MGSYLNEPPRERRSTDADDLAGVAPVGGTNTTGTGTLNVPDSGTPGRNSAQYHRPPFGVGLTVAPQSVGMGSETKQSGAGRAFIPPSLALPDQSQTPIPDGRRIARPMPTNARDESQVIRSNG